MKLAPFGNFHNYFIEPSKLDKFSPFDSWLASDAEYRRIIEGWFDEVKDVLWPTWSAKNGWEGSSANDAEESTRQEVQICLEEFQYKKVLNDVPNGVDPEVRQKFERNELWHFQLEDAREIDRLHAVLPREQSFDYQASRLPPGGNFIAYTSKIPRDFFADTFWGNGRNREPKFIALKGEFQRPRPWTAAAVFGISDFVWQIGDSVTHTGLHPAFPSGHCYQGIAHTSAVLSKMLNDPKIEDPTPETLEAMMNYAVGWGDRRVFAGVHYPTDNIASWVLALRLLPHMFDDGAKMAKFAEEAIANHSKVYEVIRTRFDTAELRPKQQYLFANIPPAVS